ncbi:helix-turn-helix domain-containing protein [Neorickettsia helminthoeca]|nr:XRE family transcriptional regulator [Neorickettsia helminthoeca]
MFIIPFSIVVGTGRMMLKDVIRSDETEEGDCVDIDRFSISDTSQLSDVRSILVKRISQIIAYNNWSQKYAASLLKIDQPKISQIKNFKTEGFSLERLLKFFILLGWKVDVRLTK